MAPLELPTNVYRLDPRRRARPPWSTGRHPAAERPLLLARREPALRGGVGRDAARDPRVRRGRRAAPRSPTAASSSTPGRASPTACAATPTATSGAAGAGARGSTASRSTTRRQADRPHPAARALRQPLLRRPQAQPALPGREPVALLDLRQHPGRGRRLIGRRWPLPSGLRAFRHADFRRFFAAQFVAQVGSWMQTVAQSWLVLQLTSSPLQLGLIGTLQFAPILLFSIVSGALADRLPKKQAADRDPVGAGGPGPPPRRARVPGPRGVLARGGARHRGGARQRARRARAPVAGRGDGRARPT